ncbi:MAG TPA: hypothetical protein VEA69_18810 [Tepidisphaeraceae bacterium]|nr:hypothetical protein [Tepidisphaeraceae bacterium]
MVRRGGRGLRARWVVLGIVVLVAGGVFAYLRSRGMPGVAWAARDGAERYELLSLESYLSRPDFYNHEILGRTVVDDAGVRGRLNAALQAGVRASDGSQMACFTPRHGIRVTRGGVTTDFVNCFECRKVQVWLADQKIAFFLVSEAPEAVFDEVLTSAGVPLAAKRH